MKIIKNGQKVNKKQQGYGKNMKVLNSSFRDIYAGGYVFKHDNIVYRCINKAYKENYDFLISSGLYDKLVIDGVLVYHEEICDIDQFNIDNRDIYKIIKPTQLPYISYPYEWSFQHGVIFCDFHQGES